jgi:DNA-binding CsgD family transcriptional regulator
MTARQSAARRDMMLVADMLRGAPGDRGAEFWVVVARNVCARHRVATLAGRGDVAVAPLALDVTPQQHRLLMLMAAGATAQEMADALSVTLHTVKSHLRMLYHRIHARNNAHAVALAIRADII